jgi:uncharacterized radical SAM superfamily Fe-S cluster-containing enzyme
MDKAMVEASCNRRNGYTMAQNAIFNMMDPEMRGFWETTCSNEIISDLKLIFEPKIRMLGHEHLDEFLPCKMEEHDCVGLHLVRMHCIHRCLTVELEYEMSDDFAKSAVLRSLPPSYSSFVRRFVKRNEPLNLDQLMVRIKLYEVVPTQVEIIHLTSICDIQCYKCFINTYAVLKYEILIPILCEQDLELKCSWRRWPWHPAEDMLDVY